ncbi:hypothetical protein ANCCAN_10703 [Ancylostoma caninum]|uniref:Uncharacterized protein n=1 Tax=Ancylostoma caninum TaxID=29170 RepID=A0A368GJ55_ANCCA|nr:hypothetical protein ANCCAN_10703 [Ancylostoma caninum]
MELYMVNEQAEVYEGPSNRESELYHAMTSHHYSRGCVSRRSSIKRALKTHNRDEAGATMITSRDTLSVLLDGSMFVHRLEPTLYSNSNKVQMVAKSGLIRCQLNTLMDGDYTTLSRLIKVLRDIESEAESALIRLLQVPSHEK